MWFHLLLLWCLASSFLPLISSAFVHRVPAFAIGASRSTLRLSDELEGMGIGIDLGTTYSAVAFLDKDGYPKIIPTIEGDHTLPSVVDLSQDASVTVGRAAVDMKGAYRHVKRVIGTGGKIDPALASLVPHIYASREGKTYKKDSLVNQLHDAEHHPTLLTSTINPSTTLRPELVSSHILRHLKTMAEAHNGRPVSRAVIGVPAYFNDAQREATIQAAALAGMSKVKLLREPEAAALAYGRMRETADAATADDLDELVLVLDLGGGTYDVSLLVVGGGLTEILCTSGNAQLGGADFDGKVGKYLMQLLWQNHKIETKTWSEQAITAVIRASERIRISLSNGRFVNIALPLEESAWKQMKDASSVLLPLDFTVEDDALLPESGVSNTTHLLCRLTRKKMEALCLNELLALLRPLREVAIAGGALLPGDADPALVQAALELEEAEKQDFPDFYPDESSLSDSLKQAKKAQQKGRKKAHSVAKDQRKFRAEKGRLPQRDQKVQNGIHGRPIARVVLVGGTTRMPVVGRLIAAVTGVVPQRTVNPDEAVALGCAVHVGVLDGDERMGTVLNPMQAAILRALAQRDGIVEDDFEMESQEFEAFKTFES